MIKALGPSLPVQEGRGVFERRRMKNEKAD